MAGDRLLALCGQDPLRFPAQFQFIIMGGENIITIVRSGYKTDNSSAGSPVKEIHFAGYLGLGHCQACFLNKSIWKRVLSLIPL